MKCDQCGRPNMEQKSLEKVWKCWWCEAELPDFPLKYFSADITFTEEELKNANELFDEYLKNLGKIENEAIWIKI